jgi:hypothetical protein
MVSMNVRRAAQMAQVLVVLLVLHGRFKLVFNALFTPPPSPPPTGAQVR